MDRDSLTQSEFEIDIRDIRARGVGSTLRHTTFRSLKHRSTWRCDGTGTREGPGAVPVRANCIGRVPALPGDDEDEQVTARLAAEGAGAQRMRILPPAPPPIPPRAPGGMPPGLPPGLPPGNTIDDAA